MSAGTLTDDELAAIEARAAAMLASADATERDEPELTAFAEKIRGHARELAALVAAVRAERAERLRAEAAHAGATDAATDAIVAALSAHLTPEARDVIAQGYPRVVDSAGRMALARAAMAGNASVAAALAAEGVALRAVAAAMALDKSMGAT